MILSNITAPLLGLVDTAVIGHLSHAYYLGATAVGAMMITAITWLCGFLRMSTTGLTAQAFGRKNSQQNLLILLRGLLVAIALGFVFIVFKDGYINISLKLSGGSEQVQFYARQYSEIRLWGLPAALANLVILGWLLGNHQAKTVMWLLIATNLINLGLDLLFVLELNWQVSGVAYASLTAEYSAFFAGLFVVITKHKSSTSKLFNNAKHLFKDVFNRDELGHYFALNRDILIRTICLEICFIFITFQGARLGDNIVAANAILLNFLLLISFSLDGIANAVEALVGKAIGQNNSAALHQNVMLALFWTGVFALLYSVVFWLFGEQLILLMTSIKIVVIYAQQYILWIVFLPIIACWCYLFDGVYIGLMQAKIMRNSMLISTFLVFFPTWFVLQSLGNHALWAAFSLFMLSRGITLGWHYFKYVAKN
ncbi:MAG: MATE family efflux transporter [Gammaproteobacteria bacterium]|nr:MAG: MATE family efflux transporter [Gammaproteobacteria bacterium]